MQKMPLTLLHTADVHTATFDGLRDRIAPDLPLVHIVRPDWLAQAQSGIDPALASDITGAVQGANGPVLCTCTTLGVVAEAAGATRIDRPMMQQAVNAGGDILMAYALQSTAEPSLSLLEDELQRAGTQRKVHMLFLGAFWPLFEAGERQAFEAAIAGAIREAVQDVPDLGAAVLAQASMAGAARSLGDLGAPVLASPEIALRHMIEKL